MVFSLAIRILYITCFHCYFMCFFGHLCYQNIHISKKYFLIAYVLKSVILSCSVNFSQYCD
jgi:hypothetical protein